MISLIYVHEDCISHIFILIMYLLIYPNPK